MKTKIITTTTMILSLLTAVSAQAPTATSGRPMIPKMEYKEVREDINNMKDQVKNTLKDERMQIKDMRMDARDERKEKIDEMKNERHEMMEKIKSSTSTSSTTSSSTKEMRDGLREMMKEKREALKTEFKDKRKALKENVKGVVINSMASAINKLSMVNAELRTMIEKATVALNTKASAGLNTSSAESIKIEVLKLQAIANQDIANAKSLIDTASSTGASKEEIRSAFGLARDSLNDLRKEVEVFIREIRNIK